MAPPANPMFEPLEPIVYVPCAGSKAAEPGLLPSPMSAWSVKIPSTPSVGAIVQADRRAAARSTLNGVDFMGGETKHLRGALAKPIRSENGFNWSGIRNQRIRLFPDCDGSIVPAHPRSETPMERS